MLPGGSSSNRITEEEEIFSSGSTSAYDSSNRSVQSSDSDDDIPSSPKKPMTLLAPIDPLNLQEQRSETNSSASVSPISSSGVNCPGIPVNLVFNPPELKKCKQYLETCSVQFTISIGYSHLQTDAPFLATLEKIMKTFGGEVELMIDDSLQWRTLKLKYPHFTQEELIEIAIKAGDEWWANNKIDELINKYGGRLTARRWKDLPQEKLDKATEKMREYYKYYKWSVCGLGSIQHLKLQPLPTQSPDSPKLYYSKEPQENFVYFEHRNGKLYYLISSFTKKNKEGKIIVEEPPLFEVDEKLLEEVFPLASRAGHPLFDPNSTLDWDALTNYTTQLRQLANPVQMAIDFTAREFLRKRKQQPNAVCMNDEEALKEIREYLFTECAAMLDEDLWDRSNNFEVYLGPRSPAMKMVHDILVPKGETRVLEAVRAEIRGNKDFESQLTEEQKGELKLSENGAGGLSRNKGKKSPNSTADLLNCSQRRDGLQQSKKEIIVGHSEERTIHVGKR